MGFAKLAVMIAKLVQIIARLPLSYPRAVLILSFLLTLVAAVFIPRLHVTTDRNILSGTDNPIFRRREEVNEMFGTALVAAVVIQGGADREELKTAIEALAGRLRQKEELVADVFYRAELELFEKHALLFLDSEAIGEIVHELESRKEQLTAVTAAASLPGVVSALGEQLGEMSESSELSEQDVQSGIETVRRVIEELGGWFADSTTEHLSRVERFWSEAPVLLKYVSD